VKLLGLSLEGAKFRDDRLLTSISGVDFGEASAHAVQGHIGSCLVRFIGRAALIRNKRAVGRAKDAADAEQLEKSDEL
jgi:hypothetical protein